ncbi:MAG: winged helix-turn-helix transcriptional regulator [Holdemanella sp.]|nr:winged helix-turn-helix transcriptional regulator [Holdemanella sp.]
MDRVETPEIPIEAIREIVVNSFAHMRVNNSSFSEIYITPTRVHIYNPGFLVKGKSPLDFANGTNGPIARNPLINTVLYLNKTIESFGTGFGRVFSLCEKNHIETKYGNNAFGFVFEFIRKQINVTSEPMNDTIDVTIDLNETEIAVFDTIRKHDKVNRSEISKIIGKSDITTQRAINKLVEKKLIQRIGSNRTGYWKVIDKHKYIE